MPCDLLGVGGRGGRPRRSPRRDRPWDRWPPLPRGNGPSTARGSSASASARRPPPTAGTRSPRRRWARRSTAGRRRAARPGCSRGCPSAFLKWTTMFWSGHLRDAVDRVDEVHVPRRAAELPVGRRAQADVLLHLDDVRDRLVLYPAELGVVDLAGGVPGAGVEQVLRAEQTADVVGAERWLRTDRAAPPRRWSAIGSR